MPSTYSPNLRVELIGNGEQTGTWGSTTNVNLGTILESAISGYESVVVTATSQALTALNGAADQSRNMTINLSSASTVAADFTIYIPPAEKFYVVRNNTLFTATISAATALNGTAPTGGATVTVPTGKTLVLFCDASNVREALTYVSSLAAGSLTLTTPLSAASGGLPTQTNFASCFLTTDGTNAYWGVTGVKTVLVATTANITLSGVQTIDGIALVAGNRVLVKDQTNAAENGIYVVADPGAWSRAKDADGDLEIAGSFVNVQAGTANGGKQYATTFKATDVVGATNMSWISLEPLPSQTNNSDKYLTTNGSVASWTAPATKKVYVATTANLTSLSGLATTIDGILINSAGTRVLVKNQTTTADNGIYVVASGSWTRANDAATAADIAGSIVTVAAGSTNGGTQYVTTFKSTDTLGVTAMAWNPVVTGTISSGVTTFKTSLSGLTPSTDTSGAVTLAGTLGIANGGTGATTAAAARTNLGITSMGTVTSVAVSGGTGISVSGSPITTSGTITVTNTGVTSVKGQTSDTADTGAVVLTALESFAGSVSANGYQKFPGGLMIQWGSVSTMGAGGVTNITFPQTFTAVYSVTAMAVSIGSTAGVGNDTVLTSLPTTTGCSFSVASTRDGLYWTAIGSYV